MLRGSAGGGSGLGRSGKGGWEVLRGLWMVVRRAAGRVERGGEERGVRGESGWDEEGEWCVGS